MLRVSWIVIGAMVMLWCTSGYADPTIGQPAPALVVKQLDGTTFDLAAERGHVVLVDVWATWCDPCRAEMPVLDTFYKKFHRQGVVLLGLSVDRPRDEGAVRQTMKKYSYPAALLDIAERNGFGRPRRIPMTYVFDQQGMLRARLWPGGTLVTETNLEKIVVPLLTHQNDSQ